MTLLSRKYIDDNDIVARYLADKLSEAERESFETYYVEHPELLHELNRTAQFKSGLMDLNESGALGPLLKQRHWWQRTGHLTAAASIVLAIVGTFVWFNFQSNSHLILASSLASLTPQFQTKLPIAASFDIQRTRTSSYDATINLPVTTAAIEIRIKPEVPAVPALYRIKLSRLATDNSVTDIAEISALQPADDGFVVAYLNPGALSPAIYELTISSEGNVAKNESSFLVEVLAASNR